MEALRITPDRKELLKDLLTDFMERHTTPKFCMVCGGPFIAGSYIHTFSDCTVSMAEDTYHDLLEE